MTGLVALAFAYVLSQFYRSFLAVLTPSLSTQLGATNSDLALASGIWFFTFAVMQFFVGIGLDRFGPRRTASLLLGVAGGAGVVLFAMAQTPWMIVVAMAFLGIACSPVLMASLYIFAREYSPARFAFLTSTFVGVGNLGNIIGATPMAYMVEQFGWRATLLGTGAITVIVALALFSFIKDPKKQESSHRAGLSGYLDLIRIKALWLIIPFMIVNYSAAAGIRGLWAGPYLADVYAADGLLIGAVTFYMALAMTAGSFVYGPLDTFFNTRKWVVVPGAALSVAALAFLAFWPLAGIPAVTFMLIIIGLTGTSYGVVMAHAKASFPDHLTGRGVTLMNFFSIGGVALMQILTGTVTSKVPANGEPVAGYQVLFLFYAAVIGFAAIIYVFSRDVKPKAL